MKVCLHNGANFGFVIVVIYQNSLLLICKQTLTDFIYDFNFSSYGLLGASGCGKTTVLSTIVGLKTINDGIITVFNGSPGDRKNGIPGKRVGYMPQETALYGEFNIKETIHYFGRIRGSKFPPKFFS